MATTVPPPTERLRATYARLPLGTITALFIVVVVVGAGIVGVALRLTSSLTVAKTIPVLVQTDFSNGAWPFPDDELAGSTVSAGNGLYVITAGDASGTPVLRFAPFLGRPRAPSVEVAATVSATAPAAADASRAAIGGIACTDADGANGYAFVASTAGEYALVAIVDGALTTIASANAAGLGEGQRLVMACSADQVTGAVGDETLLSAPAPSEVARAVPLLDGFAAAGLVLIGQDAGTRAAFDDVVAFVP